MLLILFFHQHLIIICSASVTVKVKPSDKILLPTPKIIINIINIVSALLNAYNNLVCGILNVCFFF